ncbi:MAG: phospholipase D family protein [Gemmatimonadota bacterium]
MTLVVVWLVVFAYELVKPLPEGISVEGPTRTASGIEFLYDLSYRLHGQPAVEQEIFNRVLSMIDAAEEFVVIDMFLFNGEHGGERDYRPLSSELTEHILSRKAARPNLKATFITDEINNFYGAYTGAGIERLQAAGVQVVTTRLSRLRDSNPVYSAGWRMLAGWFGTAGPGWLPHPFSPTGPKVTARGYLRLLNFKANHRKLIVTDKECLVTSANPHDASSFHSNIAFAGAGPICSDLLAAERAVVAFSGGQVDEWPVYGTDAEGESPLAGDEPRTGNEPLPGKESITGAGTVQLVTEGKILAALLKDVGSAGPGDRVDLAMFYLSERQVVEALLDADRRGASLRLVLDPNKDAFGREKGGIPNRQVARELVVQSYGRISIRWYDTHGEQFHTKLAMVTREESVVIMGGSANLTRRNIDDYNLEADLRFFVPRGAPLAVAATNYFERVFTNKDGDFTVPFEAYRDDSWVKRVLYRLEEFTGFCSF